MKTYVREDFTDQFEVVAQSENYIVIIHNIGVVMLADLEKLLAMGLECCGVTPGPGMSATICCRKAI